MSPVWQPAKDPPCLDKFCHLSHDAQRVMVAIFEDYNARKRELLQSVTSSENTAQSRHTQNASTYYQSIYEARFGPMYRIQNQSSPDEQRRSNETVNKDSAATYRQYASVDHLHQTGDLTTTYNSNADRTWAEDASTYSDSPPIETQGYRFLSQLTRAEAELDQPQENYSTENLKLREGTTFASNFDSLTHLNPASDYRDTNLGCERDKCFRQNKSNILQRNKRSLETVAKIPINSFKDFADDNISRPSFVLESDITDPISSNETYTAEKLVDENKNYDVAVTESSTFSQSLFSRDSLTGHTLKPKKKKMHKTKTCITKRKPHGKSELKTHISTVEQSSGHSSCLSESGKENLEKETINRTKSHTLNRQNHFQDEVDSDMEDRAKRNGTTFKDRNSDPGDRYTLYGGNRDHYTTRLDVNMGKILPTFHTKGLEKSIDNMHLDEESPFISGDLKPKEPGIHTPVRKSPETESEESPFGQSKPSKDVYDIFKISLKKHSVFLTKSTTKSVAESRQGSSKKRPSACKGFAVPIKKVKTSFPDTEDTRKSACHVTDVSTSSPDLQEQIINKLLESSEVIISLVFESGATQLRDSVFSQEPKKRSVTKKSQEKLRGVVCTSRSIPGGVFLFPFVQTENAFYQPNRTFLLRLLEGGVRKVGFHVQKTFVEILKYIQWDIAKVDTSWTILDPIIAVWLLDPDNPVNNFEEVLSKVGMSPMAPSDCCLDMICEDMMLLGVAMERLYKQLQIKDLWDLFICVEMKLTPLLASLELTTLPMATHTLMQFSEILKKKCVKLEKEAHEAAGHAFLLTSPSQLRQVLFEELRLDTKLPSKSCLARTSVGRETSTSESVLTQLSPFHPLPGIILEYRQVQKLKSTYIDGILSCLEDDHLRTNWDQTAAATGRLTAYQPNVQAIPKIPVTITRYKENYIAGRESDESIDIYARDAFTSQSGWTLLAADFQQIELRLLAHLADDPVLLKLFNDKEIPDIFNALTAQWLGKSVEAITTVEREQTKRVVYSVMYGVGKEKLAEHLKMSVDQAKAIMASFLLKFPAVKQFTQTCIEFCQINGYCCSIFKRRRLFPNIRHSSPVLRAQAERQAVNFCVQGSAADICKAAMIQIVHALSVRGELTARLLMQIHDELLLEVLDTDLDQVTAMVKEVMESSETLCGSVVQLKVPLPVSLSTGKTWGHMNPVEL